MTAELTEGRWAGVATNLGRAVNLFSRTIRAFYRTGYEESESLFSAAIGP